MEPTETDQLSDMDRLSREYARVAGPHDVYGPHIQNRVQLQDFMATRPGAMLVGQAVRAALAAIDAIVDPNLNRRGVLIAVYELRVQHRLLENISAVLNQGRQAEKQVILADDELEESEGGNAD